MKDKFLTRRILAASVSWILATLVLTAILLMYSDWQHLKRSYDASVLMHLEEMQDQARLDENDQLGQVPHPTERQFDVPHSGWYWAVRYRGKTLARSASLDGKELDLSGLDSPQPGVTYRVTGPWGKELRLQVLNGSSDPREEALSFLATAPLDDMKAELVDIAEHMFSGFLVMAIALVAAAAIQLRIVLRPLHAVSDGIRLVREGLAKKLEGSFPREVRPMVDELNNLIEHSAVVALRARNRLGDLAHSIKNPLTALNNEAYNMDQDQRILVLEQTQHIQDSLKHYLARARVSGTDKVLGVRTPVKSIIEDLVFLMQRVYADRELQFDTEGLGGCCFRGDAQDLEEMLGNLLDNASKWASSVVRVHCRSSEQRLHVTVEDDGPGIPADQIPNVLEGAHLDSSRSGQGRGLGIVRDIVNMYGGSLELGTSDLGGLRAEVQLPGAWASC
jgi:signal transduction histidine kinase